MTISEQGLPDGGGPVKGTRVSEANGTGRRWIADWERSERLPHYTRANAGVQNAPPHFFRLIKELTIIGFCTSEAGATKLMRYEQSPGPIRGEVTASEIGKAWALG